MNRNNRRHIPTTLSVVARPGPVTTMQKVLCILSLLLTMALLLGKGHAQSAWTRNKNSGFARLGVTSLTTSSFYTPLGNKLNSAKYSDLTASFYGEYGITNNLTGMLYFPFLRHHSLETTDSVTASGDAIVGFKYGLLREIGRAHV